MYEWKDKETDFISINERQTRKRAQKSVDAAVPKTCHTHNTWLTLVLYPHQWLTREGSIKDLKRMIYTENMATG